MTNMSSLPSGTVTFLFTDIEGSTQLLQQLGGQFAALLAQQQQILREACEAHGGQVIDTPGDAFFVAFPRAVEAIRAVVQSQRALAAQAWPSGVRVRVRMGLHTGEAQISAANYVGMDVHRAARIAAAASGGQVLLSPTTTALVEHELPPGVTLHDLGEHHLKDLRRGLRLFQLVIADLPSNFPPLKSLERSPNNLPMQVTSFVGRTQELSEVKQLLSTVRLVTLTGPGGSGKTRLALHVAAEMVDQFPAGVFFVALAPITDHGLVASTIGQALGLTETPGRSMADSLKDYLQSKALLLVLDNFEQVIQAAPLAAELLAAGRQLKIIVTSREGLRLSGEHVYPVPPLALPSLTQALAVDSLARNPAVELFLQRTRAVKPDFSVTSDTAAAVAAICHRLEGLPLAIELAAARIKLMPPRAMLARLEHRLDFLTSGARDVPARQQTLRNAIAWSYDLLDASEQRLFRQLSVFVGGCTFEAVEAVAGAEAAALPVLDQLGSLLDKSLLRQVEGDTGEPRFVMLETLREFGAQALRASGEAAAVRDRHFAYFLALAEQAEASLEAAEQIQWMYRMEQDHDNLREALTYSRTAPGAAELCLRLASALGLFWEVRGHFGEGRDRLSAVLALPAAQARTAARAKLLARSAELAYRQSDYPATSALAAESLAICRELGDQPGAASALIKLGNAATEGGDYATATQYLGEALTIWRGLGDKHGTARALINLGWAALRPGDYPLANARLEEALVLSRQLGDTRSVGFELSGLGEVALRQGDYARAQRLLEESLDLRRQLGNKWGVGVSLGTLGWVALCQGDYARAIARLGESLEVRREIGDMGGSAWCLERVAEVAAAQGQARKAVRLLAAAAALRGAIGSVVDPVDQPDYESRRAALRAELGQAQFTQAWDEGHALSLDQAIAQGLAAAGDE
jgi:predicted ATPase/class 3 adenylate cyclase